MVTESLEVFDLVVRLDSNAEALQFLTPKQAGDRGALRLIHQIDSVGDETRSIEERIGLTILSFFSAMTESDAFGLGQYRAAAASVANLEDVPDQDASLGSARSPEPTDLHAAAMQAVANALRTKSASAVAKADQLLKAASAAGNDRAREYLQGTWPEQRARLLRQ